MAFITAINPTTEEIYGRLKETGARELARALRAARVETRWAKLAPEERARIVRRLVTALEDHKEALAATMAGEIGKPVRAGRDEVERAQKRVADFCRQIPGFLAPEIIEETVQERNIIVYEPRGIAAVISPWNSPVFVSIAGIIPPLLAGNNIIWKPSEYASHTGLLLAKAVRKLTPHGLPKHTFQTIIGGKALGAQLVHHNVDAVSLTGSVLAGRDVATASASHLHPVVLELGGKDAALVLKDADLPAAAKAIVKSATLYTGQVCFAV